MENQINLTCFEIEGLNNEKNVSLTFDNNLRILLGENGTGKTTILTILYYVLSRKFHNLYNIEFSKIHLKLSTNQTITLDKEWFTLEGNENAYKYYKYIEEELTKEELDYALEIVYGNGTMEQFKTNFLHKLRVRNVSMMRIRRYITELKTILRENNSDRYSEDILKVDKQIKEIFNKEILYFPTYRRIEDDLSKLGISLNDDNISEKYGIINFGMNDVQEIFDGIKNDIKDESLTSYSNVTGNMIKHLIYPNKKQNLLEFDNAILENKELLEIVLDRFGKDLNKEDKRYIFSLINTDDIFKDEYKSLNFYLKNLIRNYMGYKKRDDSIKEFARICTKYLVNKEVVFNEGNGEISILNLKKNKIELNHLSSGEKQIVSILAQVFLNFNDDFIILFDEPELSLSIEWQEMLLPDIIDTGKCSLLLAVTHSPFIFDNKLDSYAKGIEMFIEEINI
ncbi:AAA family ATPase [Bacillus thuringiensis]|uniref:AAA family ATPase n=1 Tax=Bacillus thuringiensis TaxID=1428 RepID=UPI000D5861B6|nr:AAA family ATPase [Bacillus thuringiensis]MBD8075445.1 AAA family ATPase [Bacillus thuringiensis]MCU5036442.1 ATP-binding protein [Bacillus cereus]